MIFFIVEMDMETYVPEENLIQSEINDNLNNEEKQINEKEKEIEKEEGEEEEAIEIVDQSLTTVNNYDQFVKPERISKRKHPQPSQLPDTITILKDETTNGIIYLVGTAHFRLKFNLL